MSKQLNKISRIAIYSLLLLLILNGHSFSEQPPAFKFEKGPVPERIAPGQEFTLKIKVDIAQGNYLYAKNTNLVPPTVPYLSFGKVKTGETIDIIGPDGTPFPVYRKKAVFELPVRINASAEPGEKKVVFTLAYQGCSNTMCFIPEKKNIEVRFSIIHTQTPQEANIPLSPDSESLQPKPENKENLIQRTAKQFGLLGVLIAAFIIGIFTSLTPCVYPVIPITISVIGAGSSKGVAKGFILSLVYVLGMSVIYAAFGIAAAWSGTLFGAYTSHPSVRIIVAVVFSLLGLSMFDLFYIQTPSSLSSRISLTKKSGVLGIFLVGAASGAVVSPCVGPLIVGLLVYIATLGSKIYGFLIMWSFSLGLGVLFLIIGTLTSEVLPKAGNWMEIIKQLMGIIMFAVALYYLEPVINETLFWVLFTAYLIGIGIFIGATLKPEPTPVGKTKILYAGGIFLLTVSIAYIAGIFTGHEFTLRNGKKSDIVWIENEAAALKLANESKKPLMIDFSADWCKACQDLEKKTFQHAQVINEAKRFITLRIDCSNPDTPQVSGMLKKYHVVGLPTIIFMDSKGNILKNQTITEYIKPKRLLIHMRGIK